MKKLVQKYSNMNFAFISIINIRKLQLFFRNKHYILLNSRSNNMLNEYFYNDRIYIFNCKSVLNLWSTDFSKPKYEKEKAHHSPIVPLYGKKAVKTE